MAYQVDPGNFDGATDFGDGFLVDEGEHIAFVSEVKAEVSRSSGNDMVHVWFEISDKDSRSCGTEIRYQYYTLTEKSVGRFIGLCRSIDRSMPKFDATDKDALDDLIFGKPLVITVKHESSTYEGKSSTKNRVSTCRALTSDEERKLKDWYGDSLVPSDGAEEIPH